jgi:lantibiotic modifying enzyme
MAQHLQLGCQQVHAGEQLLMQMFEYPGRYFYRTTWLYGRVLLESLSPANLQDGVAREISLERLWKAHLVSPLSGKVIEQEIAALRQLDIPAFRFIPSQGILMDSDGTERGGVLRQSSLQEETARVMRIRNRSLEPDLDMIRSALSCIGDTGRYTVHRRRRFRRPLLPHRERSGDGWLDQAVQIGTFILGESIAGDDGGVGWVGLCLHPQEGRPRREAGAPRHL